MSSLKMVVNGEPVTLEVDPAAMLVDVLRDQLGLIGTKVGCGEGECGACTVILDGEAVNSCLVLAGQVDGRDVLTIEGLAHNGDLHPLQTAFVEAGAVQCGFCTPGAILAAKALLDHTPTPDEAAIREALSGNLCRCTGYAKMVAAVQRAAKAVNHG